MKKLSEKQQIDALEKAAMEFVRICCLIRLAVAHSHSHNFVGTHFELEGILGPAHLFFDKVWYAFLPLSVVSELKCVVQGSREVTLST